MAHNPNYINNNNKNNGQQGYQMVGNQPYGQQQPQQHPQYQQPQYINQHLPPPQQNNFRPFQQNTHPYMVPQPAQPFHNERGGRGLVMHVAEPGRWEETQKAHEAFENARKIASTFRMQVLFAIQEREVLDLDEGMELFRLLDVDNNKRLSRQEVKDGCLAAGYGGGHNKGNAEAQAFLEKYSNTPLGLLQSEKMIDNIFDNVDADDNGSISMSEWQLFLAQMVKRDLVYLIEKGWALHDCYWAHGISDNTVPSADFSWEEWWGDFWYYTCNTHHALGICLADPHNTLTKLERLNIEFCTLSFILWLTALQAYQYGTTSNSDEGLGAGWLFLAVTLPSVAFRTFLDYINQCPCLVRRHNLTFIRRVCFPLFRCLGHLVGFIVFLLSIILLVYGIIYADRSNMGVGASFVQSWLLGYLYSVVAAALLQFNPYGWARCLAESSVCFPLRMIGLGKWQLQRAKALSEVNLAYNGGGADELGTSSLPASLPDPSAGYGGGGLSYEQGREVQHYSQKTSSASAAPPPSFSSAPIPANNYQPQQQQYSSAPPPSFASSALPPQSAPTHNQQWSADQQQALAGVPASQHAAAFFSSSDTAPAVPAVSAAPTSAPSAPPSWSSAAVPAPSAQKVMMVQVPQGFWDVPGQKLHVRAEGKVFEINVPAGTPVGATLRINI